MIIKAIDEQVLEMGKLAILASCPMGMGFLQHKAGLKKEDINNLKIQTDYNPGLFIDYYQGRMVKFRSWKRKNGWEFPDMISSEYESWVHTYNSYQKLFEAVQSK